MKTNKLIMLVSLFLLVNVISVSAAGIRIDAPTSIEKGQIYNLYVQAENTELGERTNAIQWRLSGPAWVQWISKSVPSSTTDFFQDFLPTTNFLGWPSALSSRYVMGPGGPLSKSWSNLTQYTFRINPSYLGEIPSEGVFTLTDTKFINDSLDGELQPHIVFSPFEFTVVQPPITTTYHPNSEGSFAVKRGIYGGSGFYLNTWNETQNYPGVVGSFFPSVNYNTAELSAVSSDDGQTVMATYNGGGGGALTRQRFKIKIDESASEIKNITVIVKQNASTGNIPALKFINLSIGDATNKVWVSKDNIEFQPSSGLYPPSGSLNSNVVLTSGFNDYVETNASGNYINLLATAGGMALNTNHYVDFVEVQVTK